MPFRPVWEASGGANGYVSVEVPPGLAYDAEHSVQVARRLHHQADRPSLLVKIPGIPPGLTAMAQLITEGIGINTRAAARQARPGHHAEGARLLPVTVAGPALGFIDTCQLDREELPRPDLPLTVSLDGGYVHSASQRSRRDSWLKRSPGRVSPAGGPSKCFANVQTYDTKPSAGC